MQKLKETLSSKKFWAMVFGVGLALIQGDYNAVYIILTAYIGIVGATEIIPNKYNER